MAKAAACHRRSRLQPISAPAFKLPVQRNGEIAGEQVAVRCRPEFGKGHRLAAGHFGSLGKIDTDAEDDGVSLSLEQYSGHLGLTKHEVVRPFQTQP